MGLESSFVHFCLVQTPAKCHTPPDHYLHEKTCAVFHPDDTDDLKSTLMWCIARSGEQKKLYWQTHQDGGDDVGPVLQSERLIEHGAVSSCAHIFLTLIPVAHLQAGGRNITAAHRNFRATIFRLLNIHIDGLRGAVIIWNAYAAL